MVHPHAVISYSTCFGDVGAGRREVRDCDSVCITLHLVHRGSRIHTKELKVLSRGGSFGMKYVLACHSSS